MSKANPGISVPRCLYHGTILSNLGSVLENGIRPRGDAPSNWPEQPSRADCVYLTTNQGFAFGREINETDQVVVFEIDINRLQSRNFLPDEDFVADYLAHQPGEKRTYHDFVPEVRANLDEFHRYWKASIEKMGTVAHRGVIAVDAITRYCVVEFDKRPKLEWAIGGMTSSVWQYHALARQNDQDTKWFFGDVDELYQVASAREVLEECGDDEKGSNQRKLDFWLKESKDRSGIEVIELNPLKPLRKRHQQSTNL